MSLIQQINRLLEGKELRLTQKLGSHKDLV
jgi:hypothetical protein